MYFILLKNSSQFEHKRAHYFEGIHDISQAIFLTFFTYKAYLVKMMTKEEGDKNIKKVMMSFMNRSQN